MQGPHGYVHACRLHVALLHSFTHTDTQIFVVSDSRSGTCVTGGGGGMLQQKSKVTERGGIEPQPERNKGMKGQKESMKSSCFHPWAQPHFQHVFVLWFPWIFAPSSCSFAFFSPPFSSIVTLSIRKTRRGRPTCAAADSLKNYNCLLLKSSLLNSKDKRWWGNKEWPLLVVCVCVWGGLNILDDTPQPPPCQHSHTPPPTSSHLFMSPFCPWSNTITLCRNFPPVIDFSFFLVDKHNEGLFCLNFWHSCVIIVMLTDVSWDSEILW